MATLCVKLVAAFSVERVVLNTLLICSGIAALTLEHRLRRSRSTSRRSPGRMRFFRARFACRLFLRARFLQTSLQNGNQIDHLRWFGRFLWFLFDFFSAGF